MAGHFSNAGSCSTEMKEHWRLPSALYPSQKGCRSSRSGNSPGDGGDACTVFVHKVPPRIEDPAVVQGHQGMSGCRGVVLAVLAVCVLQRRKLILAQHLVHHKLPREVQSAGGSRLGNVAAPWCFSFSSAWMVELAPRCTSSSQPQRREKRTWVTVLLLA